MIGYDDDADEVDNNDDLDKDGREGAMLMVEGGIRDADTNWDAQEADLEVQILFSRFIDTLSAILLENAFHSNQFSFSTEILTFS